MKIKRKRAFVFYGLFISLFAIYIADGKRSVSKEELNVPTAYENPLDQRINSHLNLIAKKIQLHKLQNTVAQQELKTHSNHSQVKIHPDNVKTNSKVPSERFLAEEHLIEDQVNMYLYEAQMHQEMLVKQQQRVEEYEEKFMKNYVSRVKKAGFQLIMKNNKVIGVKKLNKQNSLSN